MGEELSGRRPLKSRGMRVFQRLAAWLAGTSITPNMISVSSIGFGAAAAAAMAATSLVENSWGVRGLWLLGAAGLQGRLIANLLDGMVAIEGGKASPVGDLYNEVPDRISDSIIFIGAGFGVGGRPDIGLLAALVAVFVAYVRAIGASVGAGQVFLGPMAKPQRMALLTVTCVVSALIPTAWQWSHPASGIGLVGAALLLIAIGGLLTSVRRLLEIGKNMRAAAQAGENANV